MGHLYIGEAISRLGLILIALILATLVMVRAVKQFPAFRPQLIMGAFWRLGIIGFFLLWVLPYYMRQAGGIDAIAYHYGGLSISDSIWRGHWVIIKSGFGTKATKILTGLLYVPFGGDLYGLFAVSGVLAFVGALLHFEAFSIWYRGKQARLCFALLVFWPSYAMWGGLAGKDSWIGLGLGMVTLGYSRLLRKVQIRSFALGFAGLTLITLIRPHVALMLVGAMVAAVLIHNPRPKVPNSWLWRGIAVLLCMLPLVLLIDKITSSYVGMDATNTSSVLHTQSLVAQRTSSGGSGVDAQTFSNPKEFLMYLPIGVARIYLRPYIGEGHSGNMLLAGMENALIAVLIPWIAFRLKGEFRSLWHPFALFALLVTIELSVLFCVITNLGLLSRQRAQILPFFFMITAIVLPKRRTRLRAIQITAYPPVLQGRRQRDSRVWASTEEDKAMRGTRS